MHKRRLLVFQYQDKRKLNELHSHIERLETLILQSDAELKTKEYIATASGKEFDDYEIDEHLEKVYALKKFSDLLRAQMLVSICGYFEYAIKRALDQYDTSLLSKEDGLFQVIKKIEHLDIIDRRVFNYFKEYLVVRNICVHSNSISKNESKDLKSAGKSYQGIKGVYIDDSKHLSENRDKGKGVISLDKEFLPGALSLHFDIIMKVHDFIDSNDAK